MHNRFAAKLQALAGIALMLASSLAEAAVIPPTNTQLKTLVKNTSDVQGSNNGSLYLTMTQIASRLRSTASVTKAYADVAEKNGSLAEARQTILNNQATFLGTPNKAKLHSAWLLAQKYGYAQGLGDFSSYILSIPVARKKAGLAYLSNHTAHDGLVGLAALYVKAADDLDAKAAQVKANGGRLIDASFHWTNPGYFALMNAGDCRAADILAGLYGIAGLLFPNPITLGMGVIALMWGAARFYFC